MIKLILLLIVLTLSQHQAETIIKPIIGGLNNRLRQVFSYYNYTQKHNLHLTVIWVTNKECNGFFLDYFEPVTGITFLKPFQVTNTMKQQIQKEEDIQKIYKQYTRDLSVLKPKPFIKTIINHRINILNPKYSCMHIRRTDHSKLAQKRKHYTPEKHFEFFSKNKMKQITAIKFYLATDNKYTYRKYQKILKLPFQYWPSNSKLLRKTDLLATIVDMFVCANATDGFMGSGWSSFSNTIYFLRKQQLKKQIAQENIDYVFILTNKQQKWFLIALKALSWYNMGFIPIIEFINGTRQKIQNIIPEIVFKKQDEDILTGLADDTFLYITNQRFIKVNKSYNPIKAVKKYSYHFIPLHSDEQVRLKNNTVLMQVKYWKKYYNKLIVKETKENVLKNRKPNKIQVSNTEIQTSYLNKWKIFDIVITVGPSDEDIIKKQIKYTQKNIKDFRNIYLILKTNSSFKSEEVTLIYENIFPFNVTTIPFRNQKTKTQFVGNISRNGWYLQQLFKLYAGIIIPNILDNYLVIDSDTFFLKPTYFVSNGKFLYNYANEYHQDYFEHMKRLHEILTRQYKDKSGICHHMIFQTKFIKEMFSWVSLKHNNKPFYEIFLEQVTDIHSGASEYEIFFNYMLKMHPDEIQLRKMEFMNTNEITNTSNLDYISVHHYKRANKI